MESINILIIGNCGVGKTYIMKELINEYNCSKARNVGQLHYRTNGYLNVTGVYNNTVFEGSDKLSMSVMQSVPDYLRVVKGFNIFEGDRFMNRNFIALAKPHIVKIHGTGKDGREQRGSNQTSRQLQSIETRVANIHEDATFASSQELLEFLFKILTTGIEQLNQLNEIISKELENYKPKQQSLF